MKRLIVNADDFGLSASINRAVEIAHREGILTSASLMVNAPEAASAITIASKYPKLGVGLHLVFPHHRLRYLVRTRKRIEEDIRAQLALYPDADHVNGHKDLHMHPSIFPIVASLGLPVRLLDPENAWHRYLNRRAKGTPGPDRVFGNARFTKKRLLQAIEELPDGLTEMYFHPAEGNSDFELLTDPDVKRAVSKVELTRYADAFPLRSGTPSRESAPSGRTSSRAK
jgi:predicted glycoside hydrolase/deacetylase ChbG (UPF0249 family)